jgi:hypothetical protein
MISDIKEIYGNHYSGWYATHCGWTFGLASSPAFHTVLPFVLPKVFNK